MPSYQKRHWLAAKRVERGLTQQQLADELEIPQSTYASYETGRRTPKCEEAIKIAARLELDPIRLMKKTVS